MSLEIKVEWISDPTKETHIDVLENHHIKHIRIFENDQKHQSRLAIKQQKNSTYELYQITLGTSLQQQAIIDLCEEGAYFLYHHLVLLHKQDQVDQHTQVNHLAKNTQSMQVEQGLYFDQAQGILGGKVWIAPHADGSRAHQKSQSWLLSEHAFAQSRPHLQIDTDEVQCTHGATLGQLDEEALFLLQCRGLSPESAKLLLCEALCMNWIRHLEPDHQAPLLKKIQMLLSHSLRT